jgi:hypothetical protein
VLDKSYENNSSKFYKEHSAIDSGDLREKQQKWIEAKFQDDDQTQFFIDGNFDKIFSDLSMACDVKTLNSSFKFEGGEPQAENEFCREDLNQSSDTKSGDQLSVYTHKGSEEGAEKAPLPAQSTKKISSFWRRVDMREKKVIRGL